MSSRKSRCLSDHVHLSCFLCGQKKASRVLNFEWEGLSVQLCLCSDCISLKEDRLVAELLV